MNGNKRPFLGVGWRFPLQVTPGGGLALAAYEQRIEESVYLILATAKGERVMQPEFGCGIHELVFAPGNPSTVASVVDQVRRALVAFEPRIDVLDVTAEADTEQTGLLLIRVGYPGQSHQFAGIFEEPDDDFGDGEPGDSKSNLAK